MASPGRGVELGTGIETETLDFSQLEEYINDDNESNIYFHDALVSSSELRVAPHYTRTRDAAEHAHLAQRPQKAGDVTKPHHLPDSPPDSGSEPPFSPANEAAKNSPFSADPKLIHPSHPLPEVPVDSAVKHPYVGYALAPDSSTTSPNTTSPSTLHQNGVARHHSPITVHSTSMPVIASSLYPQIIPQSLLAYPLQQQQQQLMAAPTAHLGHLFASEDFLYEGPTSSPVSSTTTTLITTKKRKLPESPNEEIQVKTEPSAPSPDQCTVLPPGDEEYNFECGAPFSDPGYQCIRFQPFQQSTWAQLLDRDMKEMPPPYFRCDADKGFNFSGADEAFVCQKKNHFQVTVHLQPHPSSSVPAYARTADGETKRVEGFALHFHGVKMESPAQVIRVEQSQSDRSKRPFQPVRLDLVPAKLTVGRLHFAETTSNNMRKKGRPNPDQRYFLLVVSLCARPADADATPVTVVAHASEKIIVRASNPGQFENDMEMSWQKGSTGDSIFHNGRVGINTDRPEESLVVHGNVRLTGHLLQPSDARAKCHLTELDPRDQLRNVASLRIFRYRYRPEFGERMGVSGEDTGVVAQDVRQVLPDAVTEAGDVVLGDGRLVEKLLVVNKERIFMENVGAVKELCRVTDNLEVRIEELERISKKLNTLRRKDSLKSTATDLSRTSSSLWCEKIRPSGRAYRRKHAHSWSSHFIQSTIVILVVIMACCLMASATLYIMEWQNRYDAYLRARPVLVVRSTSLARNATVPMKVEFSLTSSLLPTTSSVESNLMKVASSTSKSPLSTTEALPGEFNCPPDEECPTVYCCDPLYADEEDDLPTPKQHIYRKRGDTLTRETSEMNPEVLHKSESRRRRRIESEEEIIEGSNDLKSDASWGVAFHLLELNETLSSENCTRRENTVHCSVRLSRHFPHLDLTLRVTAKDSDSVVQMCAAHQYDSCPRKTAQQESNAFPRGDSASQDLEWRLEVGTHFRSSFHFRVLAGQLAHSICSMDAGREPFTEYVLTFRRRCDE